MKSTSSNRDGMLVSIAFLGIALATLPGCGNGTTSDPCAGGACVACTVANDCPGQDSACQTRTCVSGTCGVAFVASGTALPTQTAGDCLRVACNGSGATVSTADNSDVPTNPACNTGKLGVCGAGSNQCVAGAVTCQQKVVAGTETCNGLDDDCNGLIDDGNPGGGAACTTGKQGVCSAGTSQCTAGVVSCEPKVVAGAETCNGLDDDCNGLVDDGNPGGGSACNTGKQGVCSAGIEKCLAGTVTCQQKVVAGTETCNGLDDDCNGLIDDGNPGGGTACNTGKMGVCSAGTGQCTAGTVTCQQNIASGLETCNGLDDDCNGSIDEGDPGGGTACNTGKQGVCAAGVGQCVAGMVTCQQAIAAGVEICNGLDDDCNGLVDDGNPGGGVACSTGKLGVCAAGTGTCNSGTILCQQNVAPGVETCNGLDDDCNGMTDDGNPGGGNACSTGKLGVCAVGTGTCNSGTILCQQNVAPGVETCNGLDDDCNGLTDDGNPGGGATCSTGKSGVCGAGTEQCIAGTVSCQQNVPITTACGGAWTWESGANTASGTAVYGTPGTAAIGNTPGARYEAASWTDGSGNLWLFGGYGGKPGGNITFLNDLWKYSPTSGLWTWVGGANTANTLGVFGTQGSADAANVPGARDNAVTWTDAAGNLWIFGGYGCYAIADTAGACYSGPLNDLWRFSTVSGQWTWMNGPKVDSWAALDKVTGVYGTQGTGAVGNLPGGRYAAVSWSDGNGNLWLFGGQATDAKGNSGLLNDLWMYAPTVGNWTWVSGTDSYLTNTKGVYGTLGAGVAGNTPGARFESANWTDATGNFWLFGGQGVVANGQVGVLNDVWRYAPTTGVWTWMSGGNTINGIGTYGTLGTAVTGNLPGGRWGAHAWMDDAGTVWLFGGNGDGPLANATGELNDLWTYASTTGLWTWVSGANALDATGVYGTLGTTAVDNVPDARYFTSSWLDLTGNLWVFGGGVVYDGQTGNASAVINDLWKYAP